MNTRHILTMDARGRVTIRPAPLHRIVVAAVARAHVMAEQAKEEFQRLAKRLRDGIGDEA